MKAKNYILCLMAATLLFGCSKELNLVPESGVSPDQISESNIEFFLNGLYRRATPNRDDHIVNDIRGGNYTWTALSGSSGVYGILVTGNNVDDRLSLSSSIWRHAYTNIYNANIIIEAAERLGAGQNQTRAEASYLRAMLYYKLVTTFGGVPLITTNTTENLPRNTAAEIWAQIIQDLDFAILNGSGFDQTGPRKVSVQAAKALKSRSLLAMGQHVQAANLANEVIQEVSLTIDNNYGRIFRDTQGSTEVLFAFSNQKTESNVRMSSLYWPYGTEWAGSYFVQPSMYVLDELYDEHDARKEVNILTIVNADGSSNTIVSKYWDVQPIIVTRLSELYLIAAEGFGMQDGLPYLNEVRTRRNLTARTADSFGSAAEYLDEVLEERRRELFSEGFLFYDLVRTDKAINLSNVSARTQYVLPLPGDQVRLSEEVLVQNEGY